MFVTEKNPIVIVGCTDNNYSMPLATTLSSVIANISSQRQIVVCVIANKIGLYQMKKSSLMP
jgi:lipopolysaccharide biosynthesis glycosyltransferase